MSETHTEPRVTGSPDEIWLVYGELEHDDTHAVCCRDGEVSWCEDQQFPSDVRYVRADLAQPAPEPVNAPAELPLTFWQCLIGLAESGHLSARGITGEGMAEVRAAIAAATAQAQPDKLGVHLSHCNFGENAGSCKYGDDNCPALTPEWSWFGAALQRAERIREAAQAQPAAGPVAYARAWFLNGEEPRKSKRENGRAAWPAKFKFSPVTPMQCLPDDVLLYAQVPAVPAPAVPQWQPIETAPKDAEVWAFNGEQARMKWIEGDGYALWVWADDGLNDIDPNPVPPTHWMPLPAAPHPQAEQPAGGAR